MKTKLLSLLVIFLILNISATSLFAQGTGQTFAFPIDLNIEQQVKNDIVKSKLSTLWTVVTLNMIAADVLGLYVPEAMDDFTEFADGREADLMLAGAIYYQIPISMVLLSKVLPYKANRLANIIAAGITTAGVVGAGSTDPHYIVCASAEVVYLSLIAWNAWKWQDSPLPLFKRHDLGLNLNYDKKTYGLTTYLQVLNPGRILCKSSHHKNVTKLLAKMADFSINIIKTHHISYLL